MRKFYQIPCQVSPLSLPLIWDMPVSPIVSSCENTEYCPTRGPARSNTWMLPISTAVPWFTPCTPYLPPIHTDFLPSSNISCSCTPWGPATALSCFTFTQLVPFNLSSSITSGKPSLAVQPKSEAPSLTASQMFLSCRAMISSYRYRFPAWGFD